MNQIGILIEPIIKKALTSLAQEKDNHYKEAMDLLEDDYKVKCAEIAQLKADEIKWLEEVRDFYIAHQDAPKHFQFIVGQIVERLAQLRGRQ